MKLYQSALFRALVSTLATYAGLHMIALVVIAVRSGYWQTLNIVAILQLDQLDTSLFQRTPLTFAVGYVITAVMFVGYYVILRKNSAK